MLADYLQDLRHIDVDTFTVPPLLLAVMTGEEANFCPVGQEMLDLDDIRLGALWAVHGASLWGGGHMLRLPAAYNNASSSRRRPR